MAVDGVHGPRLYRLRCRPDQFLGSLGRMAREEDYAGGGGERHRPPLPGVRGHLRGEGPCRVTGTANGRKLTATPSRSRRRSSQRTLPVWASRWPRRSKLEPIGFMSTSWTAISYPTS